MCARVLPFPLLMWAFLLSLGGCAGVDQGRATALLDSQQLASSPVLSVNRDIALRANPAPAKPQDYEVGPEDLLEITLFNIDEGRDGMPSKMRVRVNQSGFVTLPLLGEVPVNRLTTAQLEQDLRKRYGEFIHQPDVGIAVAEYRSQWVSILGAVKNPGVFQTTGPRRLTDLLAMAGGLSDEAGMFVHVAEQGVDGEQRHVINLSDLSRDSSGALNVSIRPGDVIDVPRAGSFFVDGYVGNPGAYPFQREYTLTQALAVAGGVDAESAKLSDVTVFRRDAGGEVQILKCDLNKIQALEAEDIRVAENDVIVVPASLAKVVFTRLIQSVGFGLRSQTYTLGVGGGGRGGLRR